MSKAPTASVLEGRPQKPEADEAIQRVYAWDHTCPEVERQQAEHSAAGGMPQTTLAFSTDPSKLVCVCGARFDINL